MFCRFVAAGNVCQQTHVACRNKANANFSIVAEQYSQCGGSTT